MPARVPIEETESQQRELERVVNAKTSSQRDVFLFLLAQSGGTLLLLMAMARGGMSEYLAGKIVQGSKKG